MKVEKSTNVTVTLNDDDIRMAVAEYINRLHSDAKVLWHQVSRSTNRQDGSWKAYASWTIKS